MTKILLVGSGGREHAIAIKLKSDDPKLQLFTAPGNAGTALLGKNLDFAAENVPGITAWAKENRPDFVIVGPEAPLCAGLVDSLSKIGIKAFGPSASAARMEGSKQFAKSIMKEAGVPTADALLVHSRAEAEAAITKNGGAPVVLKEDGLAAGKGVFVCLSADDVRNALDKLFPTGSAAAAAGVQSGILVEQYLDGEEVSLLAFVDGVNIVPMVSAQDHKRLLDGDKGPNTGGMGAYSPAPAMTDEMRDVVVNSVFKPVIANLTAHGIEYRGVLYAGLMLTKDGPRVLEFNCRFGDPETQSILPRLKTPLLPIMAACADGTLSPDLVQWSPDPCVCVVMAAAGYPGKYEKGARITGIDEAETIPTVKVVHAGTKLEGGAIRVAGGRVLGVTAMGKDISKAVTTAYQGVLKVKFDGAQYRTDIAHRALERLHPAAEQ